MLPISFRVLLSFAIAMSLSGRLACRRTATKASGAVSNRQHVRAA